MGDVPVEEWAGRKVSPGGTDGEERWETTTQGSTASTDAVGGKAEGRGVPGRWGGGDFSWLFWDI